MKTPFCVVLDACYIIDWLQNKPPRLNEAEAVAQLFQDVREGRVVLALSEAIIGEISPRHKSRKRYAEFAGLLKEEAVVVQPADVAVESIAEYVLDALELNAADDKNDAIHIATAIYVQANFLYTMDKKLIGRNRLIPNLEQRHQPAEGFEICRLPKKRLFA